VVTTLTPTSGPQIRLALAILSLALIAYPGTARAQASSNAVSADQLFREGERLFLAGSIHEACETFAASQKLDPAPGTLTNLALCHEKEGKPASAWRELNDLAALALRAGKKDRERAARLRAVTLEQTLARVSVRVPPGVKVSSVDLDGAPIGVATLSDSFPVDPGPHVFRVVDSQGHETRADVTIPSGPGTTPLAITFPTEATLGPTPVPVAPSTRASTKTFGWALLGAGAAGVVAGGAFGALAAVHKDDHPNDSAFTFATMSDVAIVVGLAAAAVGTYFVVTSPRPPSATLAWRVSPSISRDSGQLWLEGTF